MAPKKPPPPPPPPPPVAGEEVIHVPKFKAVPPEVKWRIIRLFGVFCFIVFIASTISYLGTAEEVIQLPNYQEDTEKAFQEKKNKYQSIFKKGYVKAATHWTLFGKNLYYISIGRKTWYDAQNFCLSRDSHMVSILNDEEQKFVSLQFNESAWIGLSDENDEGIWQWSDGSRLTIQFWDVDSPTILKKNGEMERDCAYINPSSGVFNWKDDDCHALKQWVCKEIIVMEDLEYLNQP
ncbi:C-type lectin domain family 4 member F-like isoform 3-T4 [Vipera latastei]